MRNVITKNLLAAAFIELLWLSLLHKNIQEKVCWLVVWTVHIFWFVSISSHRIVASTNTCYYSENKIFWFLKSRIVTCRKFIFRNKIFLFVVRMKLKKRYLTNAWCVCQVSFFSAHSDNKQKSFFPKKNCGMLVFETLINKNSDFLNSNTC